MNKNKDITAFIIAGGKSARFGQDKLLFKYKGLTLIEHVVNVLKNVFSEIFIVANDKDKFSFLNLPIFPDIIPDLGPIGGIYTALNNSNTNKAFCFASDLPFLSSKLIKYMISISNEHDIIVPFINGFYEAMHAIYTKNCTHHIKSGIESREYQITKLYDKCNIKKVTESEIIKYTDPGTVFKNINYIEDLDQFT